MRTGLVVEDDADQAAMAAGLLRLRGIDARVAETGGRGLELARAQVPEIVLLDLMLPDTNGFEVCRQLRADALTMATPVVMLTALDDDEHRRHGFRVGANAYVTKPYSAQQLFAAIDAAKAWRDDLLREQIRGEIHVELNSQSSFLREVNDFLESLYASTPLTTEQVQQLRQAVMEMGQNAIEWGNRHRVDDLVTITYRVFGDRVEIIVRDQGPGFDREALPHAASSDDPIAHMDVREKLGLREGGFGLLISRGMVDALRYNDLGNEVTLIKRFAPAAGDGAGDGPPGA